MHILESGVAQDKSDGDEEGKGNQKPKESGKPYISSALCKLTTLFGQQLRRPIASVLAPKVSTLHNLRKSERSAK